MKRRAIAEKYRALAAAQPSLAAIHIAEADRHDDMARAEAVSSLTTALGAATSPAIDAIQIRPEDRLALWNRLTVLREEFSRLEALDFNPDQARDDHGRFGSGGAPTGEMTPVGGGAKADRDAATNKGATPPRSYNGGGLTPNKQANPHEAAAPGEKHTVANAEASRIAIQHETDIRTMHEIARSEAARVGKSADERSAKAKTEDTHTTHERAASTNRIAAGMHRIAAAMNPEHATAHEIAADRHDRAAAEHESAVAGHQEAASVFAVCNVLVEAALFRLEALDYNPDQPRDYVGQWADDAGGGGETAEEHYGAGKASSDARAASKSAEDAASKAFSRDGSHGDASKAHEAAAKAHELAASKSQNRAQAAAHREAAAAHMKSAEVHQGHEADAAKEAKAKADADAAAKAKSDKDASDAKARPADTDKVAAKQYAKEVASSGAKFVNGLGVKTDAERIAIVKSVFGKDAPSIASLEATWGHAENGVSVKINEVKAGQMITGGNVVRYTGDIMKNGEKIGTIGRLFIRNGDKLEAYHGEFKIDKEAGMQGKGTGEAMMKQSIKAYEKLGVDHIKTDAAEVGRYTWASFGYNWDKGEAASRAAGLEKFLVGKGVESGRARDLAQSASTHSWKVAALDVDGKKLGKDYLLSKDSKEWEGHLSLNKSDPSYQRAKDRLGL